MAEVDFEQLVDAHYASLYRFAFSLAKNETEAADLTQQAFYLWASKGHQLRDSSKAKAWLFTTLFREFLSVRRHQGRFPPVETGDADAEMPSVAPSVVDALDGAAVLQAIEQLEEIFRAPLVLFYLEEFSYAQIAEILGIPRGTIMSRLSRAKAQLRQR